MSRPPTGEERRRKCPPRLTTPLPVGKEKALRFFRATMDPVRSIDLASAGRTIALPVWCYQGGGAGRPPACKGTHLMFCPALRSLLACAALLAAATLGATADDKKGDDGFKPLFNGK